jgi:hypothetical protein
MATRIQVRRGTTSEWNTANPILTEGEFGYNTTLDKFKIGDGTSTWSVLEYVPTSADLSSSLGDYIELTEKGSADGVAELDASSNVLTKTAVVFEGATADDYETTLLVTEPTADRTITLPNVTGTVITTGNLSDITNAGTFTGNIVIEGATADDYELTLSAGNPTADRTITFPDATGTVALTTDISVTASSTNTFSNKSISLGSNTVTSTLAELNTAISDADVATLAGTETLTNKTLTSPVINTPTGITKTDVGLANLDNTSDANKPVSTATQTALDLKANLANPTFTGTVNAAALTLSGDLTVNGTTTTVNSTTVNVTNAFVFEGTTADDFETTLTITDPTADRTITLPDATGTVQLRVTNVDDTEIGYLNGVTSAIQTQLDGKVDESLFDVKGDILVASADNTPAKLGVGTNGYILTANSGATNGIEWAAAPISLPSQSGNTGKYLTTDGTTASWGTVSSYSAPTLGSTSIASGSTVTNIAGLTINSTTIPTSATLLTSGGALGTPSSATLTNATGLPISGLTSSTSAALGVGSIELGHATDTTIARASAGVVTIEGVNIVTTSSSDTLTNKTLSSAVATTAFTLNATAELRLADTDSTHYVGFKSPATVTTNRIWTLPSADGTSGQTLSTNGSGTLSWSTAAAGAAFSEFMLIGC